jgi:hypothetical protein
LKYLKSQNEYVHGEIYSGKEIGGEYDMYRVFSAKKEEHLYGYFWAYQNTNTPLSEANGLISSEFDLAKHKTRLASPLEILLFWRE